jgi:mannose-6-phosphate isomerase-like protein (cupin superfamily)
MKLIKATSKVEEDRGGYTRTVLLEHIFENEDCSSTWIALVKILPSGLAQAHFHENVTEIFYFLGAGIIGVNNKQYKVNEGDLVVVEPKDTHWVKPSSDKMPLKILVFKFPNIPDDKTLVD